MEFHGLTLKQNALRKKFHNAHSLVEFFNPLYLPITISVSVFYPFILNTFKIFMIIVQPTKKKEE